MACLGVLFSIDRKTVDLIREFSTDEERIDYVKEVVEVDYFSNNPQWVAELGKAWDALHRSLTDGKLDFDNGEFPLSHVILGGESLCASENYIIVLKEAEQVAKIATAVLEISRAGLEKRYYALDSKQYDGTIEAEDFEYTWEWFDDSKSFWQQAAAEKRSVLLTVDQ